MSGEGPCEVFTASGCVTVGVTEVGLGADGGTGFPAGWTKRGRGTRKKLCESAGGGGGGVGECISVSGRAGRQVVE